MLILLKTKYLPLCATYLPGYPITYIGFSTTYARQFFSVPNVSFNIMQASLMGPIGSSFIRKAQSLRRPLFVWTINEEKKMRWGIRKGLDGVVTDDPKKFLEICEEVEEHGLKGSKETFTFKEWWPILRMQMFIMLFSVVFRWKFNVSYGIDKRFVRRDASVAAKL